MGIYSEAVCKGCSSGRRLRCARETRFCWPARPSQQETDPGHTDPGLLESSSSSLANRRHVDSQATVRSTTRRCGTIGKPDGRSTPRRSSTRAPTPRAACSRGAPRSPRPSQRLREPVNEPPLAYALWPAPSRPSSPAAGRRA